MCGSFGDERAKSQNPHPADSWLKYTYLIERLTFRKYSAFKTAYQSLPLAKVPE
jgi:hypothetical protein